ncbi:recombinase family protein [Shewanella sp. DAU305]|uniref:recombinase family protein n=1 Tax=Shewanella sp. DAU305 TaxID=2991940 RepID=UPI002283C2C1|nr:recombinase family protein [Shewanella sp. DAU305]WAL78363.1 recombinase family protein [Shewanella sp. DAU305]
MRQAYSYVRLSSKKQIQGYGQERQWEAIQMSALAHGWDLSDKTFSDLGVSGWKGANIETGALSQFLKCVEDGYVEKGSVLIVENVDRLSRAGVNRAVTLLMQLLDSGISIFTFTDNKLYEPNSPNPLMDLMGWALSAQRAFEESERKSQMILNAKAKAREEARTSGKIITRRCPSWMQVNANKTVFELLPERVDTVRKIFALYINGYGTPRIGRLLTEEGRKPLVGRAWYPRSLSRILQYRAVLGEYQPTLNGKAEGEPIKDYYPAIITEDQFNEAQAILHEGGAGQGRRGEDMRNYYAGLLRCSCGEGMHIVSSKVKGKRYYQMRCLQYRISCFGGSWNFNKFASFTLFALRRLPLLELMGSRDNGNIKQLNDKVIQLSSRLEDSRKQLENTINAIAELGLNELLQNKYKQLTSLIAETDSQLHAAKSALELSHGQVAIQKEDTQMLTGRLLELLANTKDVDSRIKLNQVLRRYLSKIELEADKTNELRYIRIYRKDGDLLVTAECSHRLNNALFYGSDGTTEAMELVRE